MDSELLELDALLEYLVKHNAEHAEEIMELAVRAKGLGRTPVYEDLVHGVDLLNSSNERLKAALAGLRA